MKRLRLCSLAEVLSLPIVQLSSVRTHSTGLRAYFHNPLQKPPGYIPLSISPLRTLLTPCQFPTYFSPFAPSLNFSLQSRASPTQPLHPCINHVTRLPFYPAARPFFPQRETGLPRAVTGKQSSVETCWRRTMQRSAPSRQLRFPRPQRCGRRGEWCEKRIFCTRCKSWQKS